MSEKDKAMNIYQRINEVRKEIAYIKKDKAVDTGRGSYKAVTHDMVTAMVRESLVKHGIVSFPVLVESTSMPFEVAPDGTKAKQFRYEATYDIHFINADQPEEVFVVRIQAHAMDNADKAPGKALSYAKKYAILKVFEIETGDDDESRFEPQITDEQLDQLRDLIKETNTDVSKYLKAIGEQGLDTIRASNFENALSALQKKKAQSAAKVQQ